MISRPTDQRRAEAHRRALRAPLRADRQPGLSARRTDYLRERFTRSVRRSYRPAGTARQMVAIAADGDRSPLLGTIRMPTHVIHGAADPLVPVAAGHDLAAQDSRGATLDVIDGMGHDLPVALWPRFVAGIAAAPAAPEHAVGGSAAHAGAFAAFRDDTRSPGVAPCQARTMPRVPDRAAARLQYVLPKQALTAFAGRVASRAAVRRRPA